MQQFSLWSLLYLLAICKRLTLLTKYICYSQFKNIIWKPCSPCILPSTPNLRPTLTARLCPLTKYEAAQNWDTPMTLLGRIQETLVCVCSRQHSMGFEKSFFFSTDECGNTPDFVFRQLTQAAKSKAVTLAARTAEPDWSHLFSLQ